MKLLAIILNYRTPEMSLEALRALLAELASFPDARVALVDNGSGDESVLTVAVDRVMAAVPGVYLKSLATDFAPGADLRVRITARAPDAAEAEARVAEAAERLAAELARLRST